MPIRIECPEIKSPFVECGEGWNCNLCGNDTPFYNPFVLGDEIPLQLRLQDTFNLFINFLVAGWNTAAGNPYYINAALQTCCGEVVPGYETVDTFSGDYWTGFDAQHGAIQNFCIDTTMLPPDLDCFKVVITLFNADGEEIFCTETEPFKRRKCEETILIEGTNKGEDCLCHIYTVPENYIGASDDPDYEPKPFVFRWRFAGWVKEIGYSNSTVTNDVEKVISKEIQKLFEIGFYPMPPYAAAMLNEILCSAPVSIDGVEYSGFSPVTKDNDVSSMFIPTVTAAQICERDNKDCE